MLIQCGLYHKYYFIHQAQQADGVMRHCVVFHFLSCSTWACLFWLPALCTSLFSTFEECSNILNVYHSHSHIGNFHISRCFPQHKTPLIAIIYVYTRGVANHYLKLEVLIMNWKGIAYFWWSKKLNIVLYWSYWVEAIFIPNTFHYLHH